MRKILFAIIFCTTYIQNGYANWGDNYVLGKVGIIDVDINSADPMLSIGLLYGIGLTTELSLEFEMNKSLIGGNYEIDKSAERGNYDIWTGAIYGVYRYPFNQTTYAKLKLGGLYENVERRSNIVPQTADGFGAAGGLGFGVLAGKVLTLELELTVIDQDIIFMTIGIHYRFI